MKQGRTYTEKADVYSWGMIFIEVFLRLETFEAINNQFANMNTVGKENCPPLIEDYTHLIRNLITTCWDHNAANRPTMSNIATQMIELYKSFPGGNIPLAIRNHLVEEIDHREINKFSVSIKLEGSTGRSIQ